MNRYRFSGFPRNDDNSPLLPSHFRSSVSIDCSLRRSTFVSLFRTSVVVAVVVLVVLVDDVIVVVVTFN